MSQSMSRLSSRNHTKRPLVSFIISARNDDYAGNYRYRLSTSISFLALQAKRLDRLDDVQIVVTDWNSPRPLRLDIPLTDDARRITRFIEVPPELVEAVSASAKKVHVSLAGNVALRRAEGEYLFVGDSDLLIPAPSLEHLLELLAGHSFCDADPSQTLFIAGRAQIPLDAVVQEPDLHAWERFLFRHGHNLETEWGYPGLGTHGSGQLMHRLIVHECRGFKETLTGATWIDAELTLRVTQRYPWRNLAAYGVRVYHQEHPCSTYRAGNTYEVSPTFTVNDLDWGLGQFDFSLQKAPEEGPKYPLGEPSSLAGGRQEETPSPSAGPHPAAISRQFEKNTIHESPPRKTSSYSIASLVESLTSPKLMEQVESLEHALRSALSRFMTPAAERHRQHFALSVDDLDRIASRIGASSRDKSMEGLMLWMSILLRPRVFASLGHPMPFLDAFITTINPIVELHLFEPGAGKDEDYPMSFYLRAVLRQQFGHHGYVRYYTAGVDTALGESVEFPHSLEPELVLVDTCLLRADRMNILLQILGRIPEGGGAVIAASTEGELDCLLEDLPPPYSKWMKVRLADHPLVALIALKPAPDAAHPEPEPIPPLRLAHSSPNASSAA